MISDRTRLVAPLVLLLVAGIAASVASQQPPPSPQAESSPQAKPSPQADSSAQDEAERLTVQPATPEGLARTLQQLRDRRRAGDERPVTVTLPAGEYRLREPLSIDTELVADGLTLEGPREGRATILGSIPLVGSSPEPVAMRHDATATRPAAAEPGGDGQPRPRHVWRFPVPDQDRDALPPRLLVVDGRLAPPARHPDRGYLRIDESLPDRRSGFTVTDGDLPAGFNPSTDVCDLVLLHDWSSSRLPVASYDASSRILRTVGPIGCSADHYRIDHFEKQPRYWLEGHPALADSPGEWFYDSESSEIVVVAGDATGKASAKPPSVSLPVTTRLLVARGTDEAPLTGFRLRRLRFAESRFSMPGGGLAGAQATMHEPRDGSGQRTTSDRPMLDAAVHVELARHTEVTACTFEAIGQTALWIGGQTDQCVVQRCQFQDLGGNAINLGENNSRRVDGQPWYVARPDQVPRGNAVRDCEIRRCGEVLPGAVAIWGALQRELVVEQNRLDDCPYTGISLGWIWNDSPSPAGANRIADNRIERMMQVLSDGGGIYTLGRQPESVIEGNEITDIPLNAGRAESNGMFLDQGTTGFTIRNNTIRRTDRSPLRFHQAGHNQVTGNVWELPSESTPPVRFNNTPESEIERQDNRVVPRLTSAYLIGNSLTWDTIPSRLDGHVRWHVDCGKSLAYIQKNPDRPCVASSWLWPRTLEQASFDFLSVQPHYGTTLDEDVAAIVSWAESQPSAIVVIHTGWARSASREQEYGRDDEREMTHSPAYFEALTAAFRQRLPGREVRTTRAFELLQAIAEDVRDGRGPLDSVESLYRDAIHMTHHGGRYLMHNAMRHALGQPRSRSGFDQADPELLDYLDRHLDSLGDPDTR